MPSFSPARGRNATATIGRMNEPVHAAGDGPITDGLITGATLVTLDGDAGYGVVADGTLAWRDGVIRFAGPRAELPAELAGDAIDVGGDCITPGLVDCHTHAVFAGDRAGEFEQRLQGADYEQIARAGGGIVSTVRHTRAASEDELLAQSLPRARALLADGVTTLEVKSGYGLDFDNERKMLRVARQVGDELGIQVRATFLGAHALPPEFAGNADGYIDAVVDWLPRLHAEGLVDAVDAFCERIGFTLAQTRRVFEAARTLGLPVKLHADQLRDGAGAALPPECAGNAGCYIDAVVAWLPRRHGEGRVDAVDACCERIGFTLAQTRRVFEAARTLGLPVKLHADQLSDGAGAALVAEFGGLSADHVEHTSVAGVAAMAEAGTVAVLLPGAFHVLRETQLPPLREFRARHVPMRSEEHTSELQSLMRISYAVFCLKKK